MAAKLTTSYTAIISVTKTSLVGLSAKSLEEARTEALTVLKDYPAVGVALIRLESTTTLKETHAP